MIWWKTQWQLVLAATDNGCSSPAPGQVHFPVEVLEVIEKAGALQISSVTCTMNMSTNQYKVQ